MTVQRLGRDTTSVNAIIWDGVSFGDSTADAIWTELSAPLKQLAIAEFAAGNASSNILRNDSGGIVVLSFQLPPITPRPDGRTIKIHNKFDVGNYCYDGTICTFEDLESGLFLAFEDPEHGDAL